MLLVREVALVNHSKLNLLILNSFLRRSRSIGGCTIPFHYAIAKWECLLIISLLDIQSLSHPYLLYTRGALSYHSNAILPSKHLTHSILPPIIIHPQPPTSTSLSTHKAHKLTTITFPNNHLNPIIEQPFLILQFLSPLFTSQLSYFNPYIPFFVLFLFNSGFA